MNNLNLDNLVHTKIINKIGFETRTTIRCTTVNARSVRNKDQIMVEEFIKNGIDIGLLIEAWLKETSQGPSLDQPVRPQTINF